MTARARVPEATVARLPVYLQALVRTSERGHATVSSSGLAEAAGVNSAQVRKDLSYLGTYGTRGVGYSVDELVAEISSFLGVSDDRPVVIVGAGNLGTALASYGGFHERGFRIAGVVDVDPGKIGRALGGLHIEAVDALDEIVAERGVTIAVLAIPAEAAQAAADRLTAAGITAILNFAPAHLTVPDGVTVRRVDLSTELQLLSFYERLGATDGGTPPP